MRAAVVRDLPAELLELAEVAEPVLRRPDELLVEVEACGICGTDLHILEGGSYRPELPFVLGHEPVGRVVAAGDDATGWVGKRVTITLFTGCGECSLCRAGDERLCAELVSIVGVLNAWGGFADRLVVRAAQAVEIPGALSTPAAAALVDAGATAINAAQVALAHGVQRPVVVGGGPVGFLVAERLRFAGTPVLAVEPQAARRRALAELGHETAGSLAEVELVPDAVIDCAGAAAVVPWSLERLAARGLHVVVGYGPVPALDLAPAARKELAIRGVRSGSRAHLEEALELAAAGSIRLPPLVTWAVEEINAAFGALRRGEVDGKAIVLVSRRKEIAPSTS